MHRQDFFTRPFNPFGFVGGDELGGDQVIIIQQFLQPAPATELANLAKTEFTFSHSGWMAAMECRS
jgi:hypothetical protein